MDKSLILKEIKKHYKFRTDSEFADFLGIKQNTLSNWSTRNSLDYERIISKCEEIDANWLLTGKGSMLKQEERAANLVCEEKNDYQLPKKSAIEEAILELVFEKLNPILEQTDKKIAAIRADLGRHNDFIMRTVQKEAAKAAEEKKKLG
ncbi:helix-turn-helix domain-containing protein [Seonamhaeicola sp.]|uniref:helix-turn-helix domain-containing protein n=1 Tax=Seonamhaeicola sp. TaxID=1912245 RepID=UPI00356287E0